MDLKTIENTPKKILTVQFSLNGWVGCFHVRIYYWLFMIAVITLGIFLGFWQLDRAQQKVDLLQKQKNNAELNISGEYAHAPILLLDNQVVNGKVGYEVIQLFKTETTQQIVLVNRGWVPAKKERHLLPDIPTTYATDSTIITKASELSVRSPNHNIEHVSDSVIRIQALNKETLINIGLQEQAPYYKITQGRSALSVNHWASVYMTPEKHQGYAIQWFLLAFVAFVILVCSSFEAKSTNTSHQSMERI